MAGGFLSFFSSSIIKAFQKVSLHRCCHYQASHEYMLQDKDTIAKIVAKAKIASPGSRAWPANKKLDKAIGCRWDYGELFEKDKKLYRNLVLQPNIDADHQGLRKLAAKNSDAKLATVLLPLDLPESDIEAAILEAWAKAARG